MARPFLNEAFREETFERYYYEVHEEPEYQNILAFGVPTLPLIEDAEDDLEWVIPPELEFRPEAIADLRYGRKDLDMAISLANSIENFTDYTAGRQITLPSKE